MDDQRKNELTKSALQHIWHGFAYYCNCDKDEIIQTNSEQEYEFICGVFERVNQQLFDYAQSLESGPLLSPFDRIEQLEKLIPQGVDLDEQIEQLAAKNWKLRALLRDVGSFEGIAPRLQKAFLDKIGLTKKVIYVKK